MKKRLIKTLTLIFISLCAMVFIACSATVPNDDSSNSSIIGATWQPYNDNVTYKLSYTSEEECPNGNIAEARLHKSINFEVGKTYYMVMDFTVSTFEADGWDNSFNASAKISPAALMKITLEEAATGKFSERIENDAMVINLTYSIPENREEECSYRYIVQFVLTKSSDWASIEIVFYGDKEGNEDAKYYKDFLIYKETKSLQYKLNKDTYVVTGSSDKKLTSIVIPNEYNGVPVTGIGESAFSGFEDLNGIYIPQSITNIGSDAFYCCTNLKSITIPNGVTTIGDETFWGCYSLTSVILHDNVTKIGSRVFSNCDNLVNVIMPERLRTIGEAAFSNCPRLTNITIPAGVTSIDRGVFVGLSLESITVQDGNSVYHSDGNCIIETKSKTLITGCKNSVIPDDGSVTIIGNSAFWDCGGLTDVTIPDGITTICDNAFWSCRDLTNITLPESLRSVGYDAFGSCRSLVSITIPDGVTKIGISAFNSCSSLTSVTIPNSVVIIGAGAFFGCDSLTNVVFENTLGWRVSENQDMSSAETVMPSDLSQPDNTANLLKNTYASYYWQRY